MDPMRLDLRLRGASVVLLAVPVTLPCASSPGDLALRVQGEAPGRRGGGVRVAARRAGVSNERVLEATVAGAGSRPRRRAAARGTCG